MTFCVNCGREIPETYAFCPNCGAKRFQEPVQAEPAVQQPPVATAQPAPARISGRGRGFGIASMAVGIEGMGVSIVFSLYALLGALMSSIAGSFSRIGRNEGLVFFKAMGGMGMIFSLISLASGIVGMILAGKSLAEKSGYRFASLGKKFSLVALIISGVNILVGLIAMAL
ncbi:MAG: zinc ribbon domain-containing protein [Oscillospiraceae bacterium]|nr:zinc ribbon domain-containing protein [Oscillospiraceae bacterium]